MLLNAECVVVAFGRRFEWVGVYMTRQLQRSVLVPRSEGKKRPVGDPPCRYTPPPGDKGKDQLRRVGRSVPSSFSTFS